MDFKYRVIDPCGADNEQYIKLHRELFRSAGIDNTWVEWYHKRIPDSDARLGKTRTYGLFDGQRLIGIWSVEPKVMLNSRRERINVGRCFAVGVSSDYRRMGLFVSLSRFAIESERQKGELAYILGFPQTGRSVIGGHLKAGWEEIELVDIYSFNLNALDETFFRSDVQPITDFTRLETAYYPATCFNEPAEYRNTRFLYHPKLQYMMFGYGDAHIVLKNYSTFCHILEMSGSPVYLKRLIEAAKSIAKRHGLTEINVWNTPKALYHQTLIECGFQSGAGHGLPITVIAVGINATEKMTIDTYNWGMGVEEGY